MIGLEGYGTLHFAIKKLILLKIVTLESLLLLKDSFTKKNKVRKHSATMCRVFTVQGVLAIHVFREIREIRGTF